MIRGNSAFTACVHNAPIMRAPSIREAAGLHRGINTPRPARISSIPTTDRALAGYPQCRNLSAQRMAEAPSSFDIPDATNATARMIATAHTATLRSLIMVSLQPRIAVRASDPVPGIEPSSACGCNSQKLNCSSQTVTHVESEASIRSERGPAVVKSFGTFEFDDQRRVLRAGTRPVKLSGQAIDLLCLLLQRPGELITREEIERTLWPDTKRSLRPQS